MISGRQIGGYQIQEELGRGAMGVVFKAKQLSMDRIVAIKFLPKRLAKDERIVARFLREARAAGQLAHPNIVSVHELGLAEGLHFIAMEYVDGNSIHKRIKDKGPFTEREALDVAGQISEALKVAHSKGILHRDIKPDNFLIDSAGRVRLADLGLAQLESATQQDGGLTQDGTTLGTPHFMAPEQCSGTGTDARSDLYSLGASMFVMVTGITPYVGTTAAAVMVKVLTEPPQSLKKLRAEISNGYVALVEKLMQKDPAKRFQNATEVAEAIAQCKSGQYKGAVGGSKQLASPRPAVKTTPAQKSPIKDTAAVGTGTRQIHSSSKWLPMTLGLACVLLIGVFAMLAKSNTGMVPKVADKPRESAPTVADLAPRRSIIDTSTSTTLTAPKIEVKSDDAANNVRATPDEKLGVILRNIKNERITPVQARQRLKDFIAKHEKELTRNHQLGAHVHDLEDAIVNYEQQHSRVKQVGETKWDGIVRELNAAADNEARNAALAHATKFAGETAGTPEGVKALERLASEVKETLDAAQSGAERNNYAEALDTLRQITVDLPKELSATLKTAMNGYEQTWKANQEFAEFYGKVCDKVKFFDPITRRRFLIADAAKFARDEAARLKIESNRADAAEVATLVENVDKYLNAQRDAVNAGAKSIEVTLTPNLANCKVTHWDDKGLQYFPRNLNLKDAQTFNWEVSAAPDALLAVVDELNKKSNGGAGSANDVAAVAFTLGYSAQAAKVLPATSDSIPPAHSLAALVKRLAKPEAAPPKAEKPKVVLAPSEDDAKLVYADFIAASKAGDAKKQAELRKMLIADFAETEIVKKNLDRINADPGQASADPAKATVPAVAATVPATTVAAAETAKKDKPDSTPSAEKEAIKVLKDSGWADVNYSGTLTLDGKTGMIKIEGSADLISPATESDLEVRFKFLDPAARVRVLTRVEKATAAERMGNFGGNVAPGFGADVRNDHSYFYLDYTHKGGAKDPQKWHDLALDPNLDKMHTVYIYHHLKTLRVSVDGAAFNNANVGMARATGDTRVIISGPIQLYVAKISNTK